MKKAYFGTIAYEREMSANWEDFMYLLESYQSESEITKEDTEKLVQIKKSIREATRWMRPKMTKETFSNVDSKLDGMSYAKDIVDVVMTVAEVLRLT